MDNEVDNNRPDHVEMQLQREESLVKNDPDYDPSIFHESDSDSGDEVCFNGPDCDHPFCPVHNSDFVEDPTDVDQKRSLISCNKCQMTHLEGSCSVD